jgi:hypothetical protein
MRFLFILQNIFRIKYTTSILRAPDFSRHNGPAPISSGNSVPPVYFSRFTILISQIISSVSGPFTLRASVFTIHNPSTRTIHPSPFTIHPVFPPSYQVYNLCGVKRFFMGKQGHNFPVSKYKTQYPPLFHKRICLYAS